jgi:hypothetical protein
MLSGPGSPRKVLLILFRPYVGTVLQHFPEAISLCLGHVPLLRRMLKGKAQGRDSEKGIIAVDISNTQPKDAVAAK